MSTAVSFYALSDMQVMAEAVAQSGLFGMKSMPQALALMLVAQAEGQHPATITQDYDIIQGKACRKTHSVMARFQQMGGRIEWHELTDSIADATFSHPAGGALRMAWTIDQAKKAGLTNKDNWKNYPRAMLRARLIAEGVRAIYPAAIGGMMISEEAADTTGDPAPPPAQPKDMGKAEVVIDSYPADKFAANLPAWAKLIRDGKKTSDDIITTINSKVALTDEQKALIRAVEKIEPATVAGVTFAQVETKLLNAKDPDLLAIAADLIAEVADPQQRAELTELYTQRKGKLAL